MFRIRHAQDLELQATLDQPLCAAMVAAMAEDASAMGMEPATLRERVEAGVARARRLDAAAGFEMNSIVALSVFFDPDFTEREPIEALFREPGMSLEAKLRLLTTVLLARA